MIKKILISLFVSIITVLPLTSSAQFNVNVPYAVSNEVDIAIAPTYPKPNENVNVTLSLYTDDLNTATISWYEDGKLKKTGKGEVRFSFTTKNVGVPTKVEIFIELASGVSFSKDFTITPSNVDLVWEANSYTPPFYKGKALHSRQGLIKVVAMPDFVKNGRQIPASSLVYEWSSGSNVIQDQSGYGKNVLRIRGSLLGRQDDISVTVTDPVNNLVSTNYIIIPPSDPQIVFYENNPYYGHIFERSIGPTFDLRGEEVQVVVSPFYFSKESYGSLSYNWRLNGQSVPDLSYSRTAIFRKPENAAGRSNISLSIENAARVLQQASASLSIRFGE